MPPTSNIRKAPGTATLSVSHAQDPNAGSRRTTSGRAIRANTTRPTNYYARPFGSFSAGSGGNTHNDTQDNAAPGFYPAIQFFTDAVTALPREVIRQFTLMKEVEAKIHGPNEAICQMVDELMEQDAPRRNGSAGTSTGGRALLSLTANNSVTGSLINGIAPNMSQTSAHNSVAGSLNGDDTNTTELEEESLRRKLFYDLRVMLQASLPNLEEKNIVLAEANRILSGQLARIDLVMPHVKNEISDEAWNGSMTHWAYSDNRQKKVAADPAANRRNVAATQSLAAAANAIHEKEISDMRMTAVRESARDKPKGRGREQDSDFDERPKKTQPKSAKSKAAAQVGGAGLGITNGEPAKKRKVDKGTIAAPAMERTSSAATKGVKPPKDTPRSTPAVETSKKTAKIKAPPQPKKKVVNSAQPSPALASSPLHSTFNASNMEPPTTSRPQSARARVNSSVTNLRHERTIDEDASRPASASARTNVEKTNGKRKAPDDSLKDNTDGGPGSAALLPIEPGEDLKREDADMADAERIPASRSGSSSVKAGRGSKIGTPRTDTFPDAPAMIRSRSTRSTRPNGGADDNGTNPDSAFDPPALPPPGTNGRAHKRQASNSHLVKQLAPFNRSPDLDRNRRDDMDEDLDSFDGRGQRMRGDDEPPSRSSPRKRPLSRRNTASSTVLVASSPPARPSATTEAGEEGREPKVEEEEAQRGVEAEVEEKVREVLEEALGGETGDDDDKEDTEMPDADTIVMSAPRRIGTGSDAVGGAEAMIPELEDDEDDNEEEQVDEPEEEEEEDVEDEEEEEDGSDPGDPDDPNEPKYCYCNRGSYGEMVACDNEACPREWFHLGCTELRDTPDEEESWYCRECRPMFVRKRGGKGRVTGGVVSVK